MTRNDAPARFGDARRSLERAGMRDVAALAGVAMSSVSRVLSGHPDVSPRMRDIVMKAAEELAYEPDPLAKGLRSGRTLSVGFAVSDMSNPVLIESVSGAEKRLREAGLLLLLTNSDGDASLDAEHITLLERRRVDGLIVSVADESRVETVEALKSVRAPLVIVDRDIPFGIAARSVSFDHRAGMHEALVHLLELGHRQLAFIVGGPRKPARERRQAIDEALAASPDAKCEIFSGEFSVQYGEAATREILTREPRATAIIAGGNLLMQGALRALREAGLKVGNDISLVGCDDVAVAEFHSPQIAVVQRDMRAAGVAAAELLLAEIDEEGGATDIILPTTFLKRPSCVPPRS